MAAAIRPSTKARECVAISVGSGGYFLNESRLHPGVPFSLGPRQGTSGLRTAESCDRAKGDKARTANPSVDGPDAVRTDSDGLCLGVDG